MAISRKPVVMGDERGSKAVATVIAVAIVGIVLLGILLAMGQPLSFLFNKDKFEYEQAMNRAEVYFFADQYEEATAALEKVIEMAPEQVRPRYMLAISYAKTGYSEKSVEEFKKVLQMDPAHDGAMAGMASVYLRLGMEEIERLNYPKAEEHYIKALNQIARAIKKAPGNQEYKEIEKRIVEEKSRLDALRND